MQSVLEPPVAPRSDASESSALPAATPGSRPRWGRELAAVTAALGLVAAVVYRVWGRSWTTPFVHSGDAMAHLALLETVGWTGTPAPNDRLGAPHGVDWVDMPSGADRVHLVLLRALRAITGDTVVAVNVYLLLAIALVGVAAYVVLRWLRCTPLASGVAAIVFAVAPTQFARAGVGHLFLLAYFAVPFTVYLALWASGGLGNGSNRGDDPAQGSGAWREWVVPIVLMVLIGSSSAYYAVFGAIGIAATGAVVALRRGSWRALGRPALVVAGTMGVVVLNVAGEALRRGGDAGVRVPLDSDSFGLRLAQMLLPIRDHRVGPLADWADGAYRIAAPGDRGAPLGLLALAGVVAVGLWCVRNLGRRTPGPSLLTDGVEGRSGVVARLGVLLLAVVAFAITGGLGMVLATLGLTQIRAWSRMSIMVGFIGVAALAMCLDGASRRWAPSRPVRWSVALVLVGVAVFDQFGTSSLPPESRNAERWATDRELAADLQAALADDATVFQLPVGTYPAELPMGSIQANDLLGPHVAGDGSLRWSVGAMSGRGGDWQRSVAALPTEVMAEHLAAADVAAIAVDRRGLDDDELEAELTRVLGEPAFVTGDGSRAWYDLAPLRDEMVARDGAAAVAERGRAVTRPVGVVVEGSPGARSTRDARARDLAASATLVLTDEAVAAGDADPAPLTVRFTLEGEPGATVQVSAPGAATRQVELGEEPVQVALQVFPDDSGTARVELRTDAAPLPAPADDWGDLRVRMADLTVLDSRLAGMLTN